MDELLEKIKNSILYSIKECKALKNNLLETYNWLASIGKNEKTIAYYELLKNLNDTYEFGIDLSKENTDAKLLEALSKYIQSLDYELCEDEREVIAIENGFTSYVGNVPSMLLDIFINIYDYDYIADIFMNQLRANNDYYQANNDITPLVFRGEVLDRFKDYEIKLLEYVELGNFGAFKSLALEYFRYYYKSKMFKLLAGDSSKITKNVLAMVDNLLEAIRVKYFSRKKEIPKEIVNAIRNILDKSIQKDNASISNMLQRIENVKGIEAKPDIDTILKLNAEYKLKLKMTAVYPTVAMALRRAIEVLKSDIEKLKTLKNSITRDGIKNRVLGLPRLMFSIEDRNLLVQYLFLMGIKTNGESILISADPLDEMLHDFEQKLSAYINEDYSISSKNKEIFIELYFEYLKLYAHYIDENLETGEQKASSRLKNILHNMSLYINNAEAWLVTDDVEKTIVKREQKPKEVAVNPLDEFIENGVVVKFISLEKFKELLASSNLPVNKKYEYLRQMENFKNRNIDSLSMSVLKGFLSVDELNLYVLTLSSSDTEIQGIINDIRAAASLLLDVYDDSLVNEISDYINMLKEKFLNNNSEVANDCKIVYFKTTELPFILEGLNSNSYKQVRISLKKLLNGKLDGDKEIKGIDSSLQFKVKGKNKKIVYIVINGITIIIGAFDSDNLVQELNSLIVTPEFATFITEINNLISNEQVPDERELTNYVMSVLNNEDVSRH